jgi:hypothetical protein
VDAVDSKIKEAVISGRHLLEEEVRELIKVFAHMYPLFTLISLNPTIETIASPQFILGSNEKARMDWINSYRLRHTGDPEIINAYYGSNEEEARLGSNMAKELLDQNKPTEALLAEIRYNSRWAYMPDKKLLPKDSFESDTVIRFIEEHPEFLENLELVKTLIATPAYHAAFCHFKDKHLIPHGVLRRYSTGMPTAAMLLTGLEYLHASGDLPVSESSPFVFRADNPFIKFTSEKPEAQDKILTIVTNGISDMIDYSRGAYLSGSMISAALEFLLHPDCFKLHSNYPTIYTRLVADEPHAAYDSLRKKIQALQAGTATFQFLRDGKELRLQVLEEGETSYFNFVLEPGCDIDVPVTSQNPEDIRHVAMDLFTKMATRWPGTQLQMVTKNRTQPMYRIVTNDIEDRLSGFRDVEIYPATEARSQIVSYHVNAVRGWKGSLPGIYMTTTCVIGHLHKTTTHHHYFAGKAKPWQVIDKYSTRGFRSKLANYGEYRAHVDESDPAWNFKYVDFTSSVGLVGNFNILAHYWAKPSVKCEIKGLDEINVLAQASVVHSMCTFTTQVSSIQSPRPPQSSPSSSQPTRRYYGDDEDMEAQHDRINVEF